MRPLLLLALLAAGPALAQVPPDTTAPAPDTLAAQLDTTSTVAALAQAQLAAYNAHDLDAFLALYADSVRTYAFPDTLLSEGRDALGRAYEGLFARFPDLRADVPSRFVHGRYIVAKEVAAGLPDGPREVVAIYEVDADGRISRVWFLQ